MLGYGAIAPSYSPSPELPERLGQLGLSTAVVGKNHFGWDRKLQKPSALAKGHSDLASWPLLALAAWECFT